MSNGCFAIAARFTTTGMHHRTDPRTFLISWDRESNLCGSGTQADAATRICLLLAGMPADWH